MSKLVCTFLPPRQLLTKSQLKIIHPANLALLLAQPIQMPIHKINHQYQTVALRLSKVLLPQTLITKALLMELVLQTKLPQTPIIPQQLTLQLQPILKIALNHPQLASLQTNPTQLQPLAPHHPPLQRVNLHNRQILLNQIHQLLLPVLQLDHHQMEPAQRVKVTFQLQVVFRIS